MRDQNRSDFEKILAIMQKPNRPSGRHWSIVFTRSFSCSRSAIVAMEMKLLRLEAKVEGTRSITSSTSSTVLAAASAVASHNVVLVRTYLHISQECR